MSKASHFGARLRELRESSGLTQAQLAERAGLHPQGVVKLERGEREPAWATVVALAEALGVDCRAFLEEPSKAASEPRGPGRPPKAPPSVPPAEDLEATAKDRKGRKRATDAPPPEPKAPKKGERPQAAPKDFETGRKGK